MKRRLFKAGWLSKALLGGVLALLGLSPAAALAQGGFGGAPGGGGGGGGGGGLGGTGPSLSGLGGTSPGGSTPLSLGGTGTGGRTGGTSGAAATPSSSNPYAVSASSALGAGYGPTRQLAPVSTTSSSTGTGAGGMGGGGGGGSTTGFTSALNSTGQIQTLKANSLSSPLYAATATTTTGTGTATGGSTTGFTTVGTRRAPVYMTVVGFRRGPRATPAAIQADIRNALDLSPRLTNGRAIQLAVNGTTVVLQGPVASARERRVAELLARMTPGVRDVRNELQVPATPAAEEE